MTAAAIEATQALDVDRDKLAWLADFEVAEAASRLGEEMREPVRPVPAQDPMDRARIEPEVRTDEVGAPAHLDAQTEHGRLDRVGCAPR
jgi:hypothetical protein